MKDEKEEHANADVIDVPGRNVVIVTVDEDPHKIRQGTYVVEEFKKLVGVAEDKAIDQLINGKFGPLEDDAKLKIKGGEIFISHARTGSSS
jgi:hypothetical protein